MQEQKAYAIGCDKIKVKSDEWFEITFLKLWKKKSGKRYAIQSQYIKYEPIHLQ